MRARVLQKVGSIYIIVWMFRCVPGIETNFEDIKLDIELGDEDSVDNYQVSVNSVWNEFCFFQTELDVYQFPLKLSELDSLEGTIKITIPVTLEPGQYAKRFQLIDIDVEGLPIFGRLLFGTGIFSYFAHDNIDSSGFPVIFTTIKAGVNVPLLPEGKANNAEKLAVINVLADWLGDIMTPYQDAIVAINNLDENSTAEEIYEAYQLTNIFIGSIPPITLSNAILSIQNEVLYT